MKIEYEGIAGICYDDDHHKALGITISEDCDRDMSAPWIVIQSYNSSYTATEQHSIHSMLGKKI